MKCIRCGEVIPPNSQFCLRCGTPLAPAAARPDATQMPASAPHQPGRVGPAVPPAGGAAVVPGAYPGQYEAAAGQRRAANPARAILIGLVALLLCLMAAAAAVIHHNQSLTSGTAPQMAGAGLATAPSVPVGGPGGLANAPAQPLSGGGIANAPSQPMNGGGLANMQTRPMQGAGLAAQPSNTGPQTAQPPDDVMPYLRALAQIEAQRQQISASLVQQFSATASDATGSQHVTDPQAAMSSILAKEIGSIGNDDGPDPLTTYLQKLTPAVAEIANKHVMLLREVDDLWTTPGVPQSCRDLQGYYRASITPFVSLANAESKNPTQFLQAALQAQQQESTRLVEAEQALGQVFRSHNIQPFFAIQDTEDTGGGNMMSAPYTPHQ